MEMLQDEIMSYFNIAVLNLKYAAFCLCAE